MTYEEAIDWLFSQLPNYQNQGNSAYKPGLERILAFSKALDNPHTKFKSIHLAGTNGKGSTAHMLSSILQEEGLKIGLFTSPHLKNFTERIKINGIEAHKDFVLSFIEKIQTIEAIKEASFFEITTLMAFEYFAQQQVDIAIIETGLGGRLDASNIIQPEISIITSISLDHTNLLGNTVEEIAFEKAGIIKENIPVIVGEIIPNALQVIENQSVKKNSKIYYSQEIKDFYPTDLQGNYQNYNQKIVLKTIDVLNLLDYSISEKSIEKGLKNVLKNTSFRGRWEVLQENPTIILDTAHNIAGITEVLAQLSHFKPKNLKFVLGFVKDKDIASIIALLPPQATYYFVQPSNARGLDPETYENLLQNLNYSLFNTVNEGFTTAKKEAVKEDIIFVGGSNFVISEII